MPPAGKSDKAIRPGNRRRHATARSRSSRGELRDRLAALEGLVLDCDGVMTDGGLYYDSSGARLLRFDARDGFGLAMAHRAGLKVAVLSGRPIEVAAPRLRELGVAMLVGGCKDKGAGFLDICGRLEVAAEQCAMVGDDVPDLAAFKVAGLRITVPDAAADVRAAADWTTRARGGHGAVREVCETILKAKGSWPTEP